MMLQARYQNNSVTGGTYVWLQRVGGPGIGDLVGLIQQRAGVRINAVKNDRR